MVLGSCLRNHGEKEKVSSFAYIARLHAYASFGNLEKAFGTLIALESSYGGTTQEDAHLFSQFSALYPLVLACSRNGSDTLDRVCRLYYFLSTLQFYVAYIFSVVYHL